MQRGKTDVYINCDQQQECTTGEDSNIPHTTDPRYPLAYTLAPSSAIETLGSYMVIDDGILLVGVLWCGIGVHS
jgi:hypothetical protein